MADVKFASPNQKCAFRSALLMLVGRLARWSTFVRRLSPFCSINAQIHLTNQRYFDFQEPYRNRYTHYRKAYPRKPKYWYYAYVTTAVLLLFFFSIGGGLYLDTLEARYIEGRKKKRRESITKVDCQTVQAHDIDVKQSSDDDTEYPKKKHVGFRERKDASKQSTISEDDKLGSKGRTVLFCCITPESISDPTYIANADLIDLTVDLDRSKSLPTVRGTSAEESTGERGHANDCAHIEINGASRPIPICTENGSNEDTVSLFVRDTLVSQLRTIPVGDHKPATNGVSVITNPLQISTLRVARDFLLGILRKETGKKTQIRTWQIKRRIFYQPPIPGLCLVITISRVTHLFM
ncbi:uncharacterized protein DEA37_0008585 [Paragonimus westermani]|uniref:Uncharacterized protein n=1 Tax=Paragonimus westermani TaxID=34504 RepID=A0A5J4NE24_9TREM|nr:uncharacterized protein DEA37_0008585 [Paragonimus westermani]